MPMIIRIDWAENNGSESSKKIKNDSLLIRERVFIHEIGRTEKLVFAEDDSDDDKKTIFAVCYELKDGEEIPIASCKGTYNGEFGRVRKIATLKEYRNRKEKGAIGIADELFSKMGKIIIDVSKVKKLKICAAKEAVKFYKKHGYEMETGELYTHPDDSNSTGYWLFKDVNNYRDDNYVVENPNGSEKHLIKIVNEKIKYYTNEFYLNVFFILYDMEINGKKITYKFLGVKKTFFDSRKLTIEKSIIVNDSDLIFNDFKKYHKNDIKQAIIQNDLEKSDWKKEETIYKSKLDNLSNIFQEIKKRVENEQISDKPVNFENNFSSNEFEQTPNNGMKVNCILL